MTLEELLAAQLNVSPMPTEGEAWQRVAERLYAALTEEQARFDYVCEAGANYDREYGQYSLEWYRDGPDPVELTADVMRDLIDRARGAR